jgi:hypothetical protein
MHLAPIMERLITDLHAHSLLVKYAASIQKQKLLKAQFLYSIVENKKNNINHNIETHPDVITGNICWFSL